MRPVHRRLAVVLTLLAPGVASAAGQAAKEEMRFAGGRVCILAERAANGVWWATTRLPDLPGREAIRSGPYLGEAEARAAGLTAGLRVLDRARERTGKP
jgi:hypothetical protein